MEGGAGVAKLIFSIFLFLFVSVQKETFTFAQDIATPPAIDIMPLAEYNTYTATISEPYLSYVRSYIANLLPSEHYVAYVTQETKYISGQNRTSTVYNIAIGTDLVYTGVSFEGQVTIYKIYQSTNWFNQFVTVIDNNFVLYTNDNLVFTDIISPYPDISDVKFQKYIMILIVFVIIGFLISYIFGGVYIWRQRR